MKTNLLKLKAYIGTSMLLFTFTSHAQTIAGGVYHGLAVCNDGTVKAWGRNNYGQLAQSVFTSSSVPVSVSGLSNVVAVAGGDGHSLALKSDGTVWAWGNNPNGELGNGTYNQSSSPVQVSNITNVTAIAAGYGHSLALKSDGTVWAWGDGYFSQLGNGSSGSNIPVQTNSLTNIIAIAAGNGHNLALKNDGTVWAWGQNSYGQIGNGQSGTSPMVTQADPVQVMTNAIAIAAGLEHSLALKNDNTLWSWGRNGFYQLGITGNLNKTTPTQSNLSNVTKITAGQNHNLALKADGTVWTWGRNNSGQLGTGNTNNYTSLYQVIGLSGVSCFAAGLNYSFALKTDNTLVTCGSNGNAELSEGTTNPRYTFGVASGLCLIQLPILSGSIETLGSEKNYKLYPNPTMGLITIEFESNFADAVTVYNLLGEKVAQYELNFNSINIDLAQQPKGIYEISFTKHGQVMSTRKIVVE